MEKSRSADIASEAGAVVLSEDERAECEEFIRSVTQTTEGDSYVRSDLADSFQRYFIASCLLGRAKRFSILASEPPFYAEQACKAAAKACAIFPIATNCYEFACLLEDLGRIGDAQTVYQQFLRRLCLTPSDDVERMTIARFDPISAIARAERFLNSRASLTRTETDSMAPKLIFLNCVIDLLETKLVEAGEESLIRDTPWCVRLRREGSPIREVQLNFGGTNAFIHWPKAGGTEGPFTCSETGEFVVRDRDGTEFSPAKFAEHAIALLRAE